MNEHFANLKNKAQENSKGVSCDICNSTHLTLAYVVPDTTRGLRVYICKNCSLVQSRPRIDHVKLRPQAVSSGANWGNVRYGKGLRVKNALANIKKYNLLNNVSQILDVGSNRGSFVQEIESLFPNAFIDGIEPDGRVIGDYKDASNLNLTVDRIENVSLEEKKYDFAYCSHTLEHLKSPVNTLTAIRQSLKKGAFIYLEVPNIELIHSVDIVEEWFIDKHLFHFSWETLEMAVKTAGFVIKERFNKEDHTNLSLLAFVPPTPIPIAKLPTIKTDPLHFSPTIKIKGYEQRLANNRKQLLQVATEIERAAQNTRIAFWGTGRIYDSLVRYGNLNQEDIVAIVDRHLAKRVDSLHNKTVHKPEYLKEIQPDVVIVTARIYFEEIKEELSQLVPTAKSVSLGDLLANPSLLSTDGLLIK